MLTKKMVETVKICYHLEETYPGLIWDWVILESRQVESDLFQDLRLILWTFDSPPQDTLLWNELTRDGVRTNHVPLDQEPTVLNAILRYV